MMFKERFGRKAKGWAPTRSMVVVTFMFLLVMLPVIYTLADPPSKGVDVCDDCHGGRYDIVIEDPTFTLSSTIEKGESQQVTVTVDVSADGTNSYWEFDMTVRLRSVNGKVTVSAAQTFRNQRPAGASSPYTWTKDVIFTITGKNAGSESIRAEAAIDPDHFVNTVTRMTTHTITVTNQAPTLTSGYFTPASGPHGTEFEFGVTFADANDEVPSYIRVVIGASQYSLTLEDGTPDSLITGEIYSVSGLMLDEGTHQYHFEASDGDDQARLPASGELDGPQVLHVNSAPTLQNNHLSPVTGYSSDQYTFRVTYSDPEDQEPSGGVILILNNGERTETMTVDQSASPHLKDGVYSNGETYSITISLSVGSYAHSFNASDGEVSVEIGPFNGPYIDDDPIIRISIDDPLEGSTFLDNEEISFLSTYTSNIVIADAVFRWESNQSGLLGTLEDLDLMLAKGEHSISVNVSSASNDISDEATVNITVIQYVPPVVHPLVSIIPTDLEREVDEGDPIDITIEQNLEHPDHLDGEDYQFRWYLNGDLLDGANNNIHLEFSYLDSGLYTLDLNITLGDLSRVFTWNITVNDVPAPIDNTDTLPSDLGQFQLGDRFDVLLPLQDREGRDLTVEWKVNGSQIEVSGLEITIILQGGFWADEGPHSLVAMVSNPDGNTITVDMTYSVVYPVIGDDDDDDDTGPIADDDDEEPSDIDSSGESAQIGAGGYAIIIIGGIALLAGVFYGIYAIVAPVEKKQKEESVEVMDWDMDHDKIDIDDNERISGGGL